MQQGISRWQDLTQKLMAATMGVMPMSKKRQDQQPRPPVKKSTHKAKRLRKRSSQRMLNLIHQTPPSVTCVGQRTSPKTGHLHKTEPAATGNSSSDGTVPGRLVMGSNNSPIPHSAVEDRRDHIYEVRTWTAHLSVQHVDVLWSQSQSCTNMDSQYRLISFHQAQIVHH